MASRMEADRAACAVPVAAAPAAAPVVIEREVERLVIATDALFAFDRSGLDDIRATSRAAARPALAKRAQGLQDIERIVLVGHTDRLGSDAHNEPLSLRRATAVRDYLVSQGLAADLFTVEGRGSAEPVKTCAEQLPRDALIACLQDNRRVEVEIRGRVKSSKP